MGRLLDSLVKMLPQELRKAYSESPRENNNAHRAVEVIVARHLYDLGFRQIAFEKPLQLSDGRVTIVDVYGGEDRLCIECKTRLRRSAIIEKIEQIRLADPGAKYVIAVPDYMGYRARKFEDLAEVWVACRDGRVLKPGEWIEWRKNYLLGAVDAQKIALLLECYRDEVGLIANYEEGKRDIMSMLSGYMAAAASILGDASWLQGQPPNYRFPQIDETLEFARSLAEDIRMELLAEIVELVNRLVSLSEPYRLRLEDDGVLAVEYDLELDEWLGEKPIKSKKTKDLELRMLCKNLKPKIQACMESLLKKTEENSARALLYEMLEEGKIAIHNKRLLEKLKFETSPAISK